MDVKPALRCIVTMRGEIPASRGLEVRTRSVLVEGRWHCRPTQYYFAKAFSFNAKFHYLCARCVCTYFCLRIVMYSVLWLLQALLPLLLLHPVAAGVAAASIRSMPRLPELSDNVTGNIHELERRRLA